MTSAQGTSGCFGAQKKSDPACLFPGFQSNSDAHGQRHGKQHADRTENHKVKPYVKHFVRIGSSSLCDSGKLSIDLYVAHM